MPDWLRDSFHVDNDISIGAAALRLAMALVFGCVVGGVYRLTQTKFTSQKLSLLATLVLLTVLIAMVTLVIGNSVARAFSLVGALAIVRFRTVVDDTRDTAFVIFAVGVGMAIGAGYMLVPLVAIPFAAIAALLFRPREVDDAPAANAFVLTVRVSAGQSADALARSMFAKYLESFKFSTMATARQGAAYDITYAVRLQRPDAAPDFVTELGAIAGIQSVELRRD